jgi:hypothetical protein
VPQGTRRAEGVRIPAHCHPIDTPSANYLDRTEWNVRDSDGMPIISLDTKLPGGSLKTAESTHKSRKPCPNVHPGLSDQLVAGVRRSAHNNRIQISNMAGSPSDPTPENWTVLNESSAG